MKILTLAKNLIFILVIPFTLHAEGPILKHKDPIEQQEFENTYQDLRKVIPSNRIIGTTNDSDLVGGIGEVLMGTAAGINAAGSTQWGNVATVNLTAGHWLVSGWLDQSLNGATMTGGAGIALSAFSGNTTTDHTTGDNASDGAPPTGTYDTNCSIPDWKVDITVAGTYYLKSKFVYSAGTPRSSGRITAVRRR